MMSDYGSKIQAAQDTNANVAQVIVEQNKALANQQQEVQALQHRLQQEQTEYESKYKKATEEVQRINNCAAQELDVYKQALAAREAEIAKMRAAGQQLDR